MARKKHRGGDSDPTVAELSSDKTMSGGMKDINPSSIVDTLDKATKRSMSNTAIGAGGFDKIPAKVESDKTDQRKKGNNFYREQ